MLPLIRIISFCSSHFTFFGYFLWKWWLYLNGKEFSGMSSYGPESSSIEKFIISATFFIFIMSSYLSPIQSYNPFCDKIHVFHLFRTNRRSSVILGSNVFFRLIWAINALQGKILHLRVAYGHVYMLERFKKQ